MAQEVLQRDQQQDGPDSGTVNYEQLGLENLCREFVENFIYAIEPLPAYGERKDASDRAGKLLARIVQETIEYTAGCILHGIDNPEKRFYRVTHLVERCNPDTGKITKDADPYVTILEAYNLAEASEMANINAEKMLTSLKRLTVIDVQETENEG